MGATPSSRCFNNASPFTFLTTLVSVPPSLSLSSFLYLQILAFSLSVVFLALAIFYRRLLLLLYQYNRGVGHCRYRRQIIWGKRAVLLPLPHSLLSPLFLPSLSLSLSASFAIETNARLIRRLFDKSFLLAEFQAISFIWERGVTCLCVVGNWYRNVSSTVQ